MLIELSVPFIEENTYESKFTTEVVPCVMKENVLNAHEL